MKTDTKSKPMIAQRTFPARWLATVGIGGAWFAVAAAETLMSNGQDALDDVGMIGENYGPIASAGILHWVGGMLLVVGLVGVAPLVWRSRIGRAGWFLTLPLAVGLGAFAMVHLLALETAAAGLNGEAMNQFLIERLGEGSGPWTILILFVALVGPWSFALLLVGLVLVRQVSWVSPALFAVGAVAHMLLSAELVETMSLWVMAAGGVLAAYGILRSRARADDDVGSRSVQ